MFSLLLAGVLFSCKMNNCQFQLTGGGGGGGVGRFGVCELRGVLGKVFVLRHLKREFAPVSNSVVLYAMSFVQRLTVGRHPTALSLDDLCVI